MTKLRLLSALVCAAAIAAIAATAHPARAVTPGADGRIAFIAFTSGATGNLFTIEPDGSGLKQVTFLTSADGVSADEPQWSPDGRQIVFTEYPTTPDGQARLWLVNADGSGLHPLLSESPDWSDHRASFSPDGSRVIFFRCGPREFCAIYTVKTDGHGLNAQTHDIGGPGEAFDVKPEFSPDGKTISFSSFNRGGVINGIYLMSNGSKLTLIPQTAALTAVDADWAPDGSKLVFYAPCCLPQVSEIYTIKPDGSGLQALTDGSQGQDFRPAYSPQGDQIVFQRATFDFSSSDVAVMNADGSGQHVLVADAGSPAWGTAP